ncbi:hypothetical protein GCM10028777_25260 [Angustibacter speluncae]
MHGALDTLLEPVEDSHGTSSGRVRRGGPAAVRGHDDGTGTVPVALDANGAARPGPICAVDALQAVRGGFVPGTPSRAARASVPTPRYAFEGPCAAC